MTHLKLQKSQCLAVGLACGDQCRLTGNGSALEVVLHDYALCKSTFTLLYFYSVDCYYAIIKILCYRCRCEKSAGISDCGVASERCCLSHWYALCNCVT